MVEENKAVLIDWSIGYLVCCLACQEQRRGITCVTKSMRDHYSLTFSLPSLNQISPVHAFPFSFFKVKVKVKVTRNRPGIAQRVPGSLGSQISMTFATWRWWGQPHAPVAFIPRKCSWYSFSLGAESTPGPWYRRKEYGTEKSSDTTGKRSRDRPTSALTTTSPQAPFLQGTF